MRRFSTLVVVPVALVTLMAGCGSSSKSSASAANKASFCAANATLDRATASVTTPAQLLQALKANQSAIDEFGKTAPSLIATEAQVLVSGAKAAIKAGSVTTFNTKTFASAGQAVDTYCGQGTSGSSSQSATATTS
jgi:hypothetical protein